MVKKLKSKEETEAFVFKKRDEFMVRHGVCPNDTNHFLIEGIFVNAYMAGLLDAKEVFGDE